MSKYWSDIVHKLTPYVPGEQPKLNNLIKLNTNENPYGPSPKVIAALQLEATETLRLYPDPNSDKLKSAIAEYHGLQPNQVFVGNGSDEVLAHVFQALLKHDRPLLFPDISYSFYPVNCRPGKTQKYISKTPGIKKGTLAGALIQKNDSSLRDRLNGFVRRIRHGCRSAVAILYP